MRGSYTCVYREIWSDPLFLALSDAGKLVYFYVLTTPLGNGLGCFRAGVPAMSDDMGWSEKQFRKSFAEGFGEQSGKPLFMYDDHHKVLFIPKYFLRNPPNNPNGIIALGKSFVQIPDCQLKAACFQMVKSFVESKGESFAESFAKSFAEPIAEPPGNVSPSYSPSPSPSPSVPVPCAIPTTKATATTSRASARIVYTVEFESFWTAYPLRKGKAEAARAWAQNNPPLPDMDTLLAAIEAQKAGHDWKKDGGAYIPNPATWLRRGQWDDIPRPPIIEESYDAKRERLEREERARGMERAIRMDAEDAARKAAGLPKEGHNGW